MIRKTVLYFTSIKVEENTTHKMDEDFISFTAKVPTRIKEDDSPWSFLDQTRADKNGNPLVRLHNELLQFCNFVSLTSDELKERENVIKEVESIILKRFPTAKVQPFGSYISKLLTPMSDIDLVCGSCDINQNNLS
jgi:DNA polymerase sigma